jgi:hypothetical protein
MVLQRDLNVGCYAFEQHVYVPATNFDDAAVRVVILKESCARQSLQLTQCASELRGANLFINLRASFAAGAP